MTLAVLIKPEAEHDLREAFDYYESVRSGYGREFRDRIDAVVSRLVELPMSAPIVYRDVRRALVRDFPFSVFYLVETARIVVLAVLHQARDPAGWPIG